MLQAGGDLWLNLTLAPTRQHSSNHPLPQNDDIILMIDEVHTLIGAGAAEGAIDAANILKPALARGELQVRAGGGVGCRAGGLCLSAWAAGTR